MRIAGIVQDSIVDGPGLRFTVFTQGCRTCCEGCHNPDTWDLDGGTEMPVADIITSMRSNPLTDGLTLSGGEPFIQAADCASLAAAARDGGLSVWVFTGCVFERLIEQTEAEPAISRLLELTDVLVDGSYMESERTLSLKWRGSKNQRVLDVVKSMAAGNGVLYEDSAC